MKDNNKVQLSNLKYYPNLERLVRVQEQLANNKVIQEAKANNVKVESNTSTNPII